MNVKLEAADFLDAVAFSVATQWGRGSYTYSDGSPCCLLGHMWNLKRSERITGPAYRAASESLSIQTQHHNPAVWNDRRGRTQEQVIHVLHAAANRLRRALKLATPET